MSNTVLLVDDDTRLLAGLKRALRKDPFSIACANSAEQALAILSTQTVDAVVADQNMPGMKGTTFLAKVRSEYPLTSRFLLTGNATLDVAIEAINASAIRYFFTKPCNHNELSRILRRAIHQRTLTLMPPRLELVSDFDQQNSRLAESASVGREHKRSLTQAPDKARFKEVFLFS